MDISDLGAYTDYVTSTASQSSSLNSTELKKDYSSSTDDELMDVCKEFEAYFVEQVYKEMMKTVPESEFSSESTSSMVDYFKDEVIQDIASDTSEQGGLGIAQSLYEQMKRNYDL